MAHIFRGYLYTERDEEGYMKPNGITFKENRSHTASPDVGPSDFPGYCNMARDVDGYMIHVRGSYMTFEKD